MNFVGEAKDRLEVLEDETRLFLGRKKSLHDKYQLEGALLFGKCLDEAKYGKLVNLDAISPHVVFICGARGSGKCLLPSEHVLMADGTLKSMEQLFEELAPGADPYAEELFLPAQKESELLSMEGDFKISPRKLSHVYRKHVHEDLIEITTRSGRKVTATKEHPLLGFDGKPAWKPASQVRVGDHISSPRHTPVNKPEKIHLRSPSSISCHTNSKSQHRANFLRLLQEGPKQVSKLAKELHTNKAWDIAYMLQDQGLVQLQHCSPLTATLTEDGKKICNEGNFKRLSPRSMPISIPGHVSLEFMRFIAYSLAEGTEIKHDSTYRLMFTNTDERMKGDFRSLLKKLFSLEARSNGLSIYVDSIGLGLFLDSIGYSTGQKSKGKRIPGFVLESPDELVSEFLKTYADCEAYMAKGQPVIEFSTASEDIANKLGYLLLRFGIFSSVRESWKYASNTEAKMKRKYYSVFISGKTNLELFHASIGFGDEKKQARLETHLTKKANPNLDVIPHSVWDLVRDESGKLPPFSYQKFPNSEPSAAKFGMRSLARALYGRKRAGLNRKYAPSREKLSRIAEILGSKQLANIANSDLFWDEVVALRKIPYDGYVYDLTVPETHNFIAGSNGGVICHNSYDLGVIGEELVLRNPNVAAVIIDPVGIFWSMKHPNKDEKEMKDLVQWDLEPQGLEKTKVFIPQGLKNTVPKETYDALFSIKPSELTVDDWCLTFNLERFSPTTLLLEKAIEKAKEKYSNYSLDELISTIEKDKELTSRDKGYNIGTRRALLSRLEAAKSWGILSKDGTSLSEVCSEGNVTVIDISFLEENVSSLVIGMLARKILNARKRVTRQASMEKYVMTDIDDLLDVEIPPTWLFIDEAHTLIPSGGSKTAATDSLIEYVKQGRRPGCSLVFATQQPSAIDTKVLSQLDILVAHKLVFEEDIKAVMKRVPTVIPPEYMKPQFIRSLPIGVAMIADRSERTSRAFTVQVRPRFSQHEGRETTSIELDEKIDPGQIKSLIVDLICKKLEAEGRMPLRKVESISDTLARRYKIRMDTDLIIEDLKQNRGCTVKEGAVWLESALPKYDDAVDAQTSEDVSQKALPMTVDEGRIRAIAEKNRKTKKLGLFGKDERVGDIKLVYYPAHMVAYDLIMDKGFKPLRCFVSHDYELMSMGDKGLSKTSTMNQILSLSDKKLRVLNELRNAALTAKEVQNRTLLTAQAASKYLRELAAKGLVSVKNEKYTARKDLDIPRDISLPKYAMGNVNLVKPQHAPVEDIRVNEKIVREIPKLFGNVRVNGVEMVLLPVWRVAYESEGGIRTEEFNAL